MDAPATTNGGGDANGGPTEEELERQRMRPADVDADMREMARRKRVDAILGSKSFKSELERLVDEGVIDGNSVGGCLQHITDMMGLVRGGVSARQSQQCVQPIADLRGAEASQFSKAEKLLRCKLASLFRVIDMHGWAQGVHGHITVRLNQEQEHFLVNPHGLLYGEMTASTLIKADMQGTVLHPGSTGLGLSGRSYGRLAAVHAARPDLRCLVHVQQPAVVAVSALRAGLLPLTEDAAALGPVAVHRPTGDDPEHQRLAGDLGPTSKVLLLQNGGALCGGETVDEAFFLLGKLVAACENQVRMLPLGLDNLNQLDEQEQQRAYEEARRPASPSAETPESAPESPRGTAPWRLGQLEFEALMRQMDNAGYRTGHVYRYMLRGELPAHQSDVEYPPAASGYVLDTDDIFKYSPMRKIVAGARAGERTRWLNSPNIYQKVEVLETGTNDPKTITKWVEDPTPAPGGTPVKVDAALQFVPKNTNPKEFKRLQKQIKENRRAGEISAGPQSSILEGVGYSEPKQLQDAAQSHAGDQVVLVGAASKGIIQRGHQHNAAVYHSPYAKNPFDGVTDGELEEYQRMVESKSRGHSAEPETITTQQSPKENQRQPDQHKHQKQQPFEHPQQHPQQHQYQQPQQQFEQRQHSQPEHQQFAQRRYQQQLPERAERVQLTSDGEELDVSSSSAPPGDAPLAAGSPASTPASAGPARVVSDAIGMGPAFSPAARPASGVPVFDLDDGLAAAPVHVAPTPPPTAAPMVPVAARVSFADADTPVVAPTVAPAATAVDEPTTTASSSYPSALADPQSSPASPALADPQSSPASPALADPQSSSLPPSMLASQLGRAQTTGSQPPASHRTPHGDGTVTGDGTDTGQLSTPPKINQENSTSETSKKDKKKKGLRTPSFMRKKDKKKDKKDKRYPLETAI